MPRLWEKACHQPSANTEQHLSPLSLLTVAERQQRLVAWNATEAEYLEEACIHKLFEAQVELTPEAVAVVCEDQQLTYRELNQRANQLAHHLCTLGVRPEVLVGICMERSLGMLIGLLGILKAGGTYIPLDPAYPKERLAFMLEDSQATVLLSAPFHKCL
jgi:non-ribosomal peptide synthetase component F